MYMCYVVKQNLEECWSVAEHFLDLPDFLSWRATGDLSRYIFTLLLYSSSLMKNRQTAVKQEK